MAPASSIGLYIGTETADLVQLSGSFQHPRILQSIRITLPSQGILRSQIRAEEQAAALTATANVASSLQQAEQAVSKSLMALFQKAGLSASVRAHTAIAPEAAVIRYFQMPTIPPNERKTAVAFEAKKYLPFKLEELVTDFQVAIRRSDPAIMRIMFFGIKKSAVSAYLQILQSAGCIPLSLEAVPVSLLRLLRQADQFSSDQVAAILCIEKDSALISIASDSLLYLSRNVTVMNPGEETTMGGISPELLEAIVNETRVSIDYYRRRFLGEPAVGKVILYSPYSDPKQAEALTGALDIPVELGNPFKKMTGMKEAPNGFAVAAGLALRGLEKRTEECNLLPAEHRRELQGLLKPVALEAIVAALVLGSAYCASTADISSRQQSLRILKGTEILPPAIQPETPIADLQTIQTQQQRQLRFLKEISKPGTQAALLRQLTRFLPEEAWLRSLLLENSLALKDNPQSLHLLKHNLLKIVGSSYAKDQTKEFDNINNFLNVLRSDPTYKSVFNGFTLDSVQRGRFQEEAVTEFQLTCTSQAEDGKRAAGELQNP